jgi:hypothetical protein
MKSPLGGVDSFGRYGFSLLRERQGKARREGGREDGDVAVKTASRNESFLRKFLKRPTTRGENETMCDSRL